MSVRGRVEEEIDPEEQEAIIELLKKLDVTRDDLGFEKEITIEENNFRERQRKVWLEIIDELLHQGYDHMPSKYIPDKSRSIESEIRDTKRKKKKKKKKGTAFTGDLKPPNFFNKFRVETVLKDIVGNFCDTMKKFHKKDSQWIAMSLAGLVLQEVYKLQFTRHKFIVMVRIYEELNQYKKVLMTYIWDCDFDGHCHYQQIGPGYVVVVSVLALYIE